MGSCSSCCFGWKENSEASQEERPIMYQYSRINGHSTEVEGRKKNRLWESDFPKRNSGGLKTDEDSETLYECTGPLKKGDMRIINPIFKPQRAKSSLKSKNRPKPM